MKPYCCLSNVSWECMMHLVFLKMQLQWLKNFNSFFLSLCVLLWAILLNLRCCFGHSSGCCLGFPLCWGPSSAGASLSVRASISLVSAVPMEWVSWDPTSLPVHCGCCCCCRGCYHSNLSGYTIPQTFSLHPHSTIMPPLS